MFVNRRFRNRLNNIPMFYQFAVFDSENIHDGTLKNLRFDHPMIMNGDKVSFRQYALEVVIRRGMLVPEFLEISDKVFLVVSN